MSPEISDLELSFDRSIWADDLLQLFTQSNWAADRQQDDWTQILAATTVKLGIWQGAYNCSCIVPRIPHTSILLLTEMHALLVHMGHVISECSDKATYF